MAKTRRKRSVDPIWDIPRYLGIFRSFVGRRMYLVFGLGVLAALAEGIGIVMLLPLVQSLDQVGDGTVTGVGAWLNTVLEWLGLAGSTLGILLLVAGFFFLKGVFLFLAYGYTAYLKGRLLRELKGQLYDAYSRMRLQHYVARDTGHFVNVINKQISDFIQGFNAMINLGKDLVMVMVYVGAALVVAWRFGVMAIILGVLLFAAFQKINVYIRVLSRATAAESGNLSKLVIQSLQAFKYLAATGRGASMRKKTVT
ncbi:ABC transporter transmembrane domain-containing protein, partial [Thioalkalivibrio sp.]|uniref:ABC transporter transmembrane domain-containing protein n=1 Tax=Thioalkalivibrio sp. TaxID=2093813 RepID=UPI0035654447